MYDLSQGYILNIRKLHLREQLRALVKYLDISVLKLVVLCPIFGCLVMTLARLDLTQLNELEVNVIVIAHI